MQTLEDYAHKSGVALEKEGVCQFCGSHVTGGVYECFDIFYKIVGEAAIPVDTRADVQLIIVDAHALQHSEVHGIRNNNYHLLRLLGIYEYHMSSRIGADYTFLSPVLDPRVSVMRLESPLVGNRGYMTISDIVETKNNETIKKWGQEVLNAWSEYEDWAEKEWSRLRA
jgi:hypothetical protein